MNRRLQLTFALLITCLCSLALPALAQRTIRVPVDQPTIQAAINSASAGDVVLIAPGTYFEHIDFLGKAITVTSSAGPSQTVIDGGNQAGAVVRFVTNETRASTLSGLTVQHGGQPLATYQIANAGIFIQGARPSLISDIVNANNCQAIAVSQGGPLIQNTEISNTQAAAACHYAYSGGVLVTGPYTNPANAADITPVFLLGNILESNSSGQAPTQDNVMRGGAAVQLPAAGNPVLVGNVLRNNTAQGGEGGAILVTNISVDRVVIAQNLIYGNSAGTGGGIFSLQILLLANNTIVNNVATGSPINAYPTSSALAGLAANSNIVNNIIVANTTVPAIACAQTQTVITSFSLGIFDHNQWINSGGPLLDRTCQDTTSLYGNQVGDPGMASPATGDFHLKQGSPAIDTGNSSALALLKNAQISLLSDFDGNPREQDATGRGYAIIDRGAYEFAGTVDAASTRIVLVPGSPLVPLSQPTPNGTLTATISSAAGMPAGSISFFEDGQPLGLAPIVNGVATLAPVDLEPGEHVFYATYAGTSGFAPAVSVIAELYVDVYSTSTTITGSPNPAFDGQPVTFLVHVASAGAKPFTAPVTLTDGTSTLATLQPDSNGNATFTTSSLVIGQHSVTASFPGDSNHFSSSATTTETILFGHQTTLTLSSSLNPSMLSQAVTFSVHLSASNPALVPSGSVSFSSGGVSLAMVPVDGSGNASFTTAALPVGNDVVTAAYTAAGGFSTSNANLAQVILQPTSSPTQPTQPTQPTGPMSPSQPSPYDLAVTLQPAAVSIQTEHHQSLNVSLTSIGGLVETYQLSCGPLPAFVTCRFADQQLKLTANGTVSTQLTVDTDAVLGFRSALGPDPTGLGGRQPGSLGETLGALGAALALLLPCTLPSVRRRRRVWSLFTLFTGLLFLGAISGCSGKYPGHTPPGTYAIQVIASSVHATSIAATRTATLTLTVTP